MRKRSGCTPQQCYQKPPVKDLQMRGGTDEKGNSWSTSEMTKVQIGSSSILYPMLARTHPKQPITSESVNRGFCVLRSRRTCECSQQHSWKQRTSQGDVEGLPRSPGGCNQNAWYFKEHSALSASYRWGKGALGLCGSPRDLAHAIAHGY